MKRNLKRLGAILLALVMVLSFSTTAFAAGMADLRGQITVKDVEEGATVTAYKIVNANFTDAGKLIGYQPVIKDSIADVSNPTVSEITTLAQQLDQLGTGIDVPASGSDYVKDGLEAGMYLIVVTKTNSAKVYNPMVASVGFDENNALKNGEVSANSDKFMETVYAKSSEPKVDKIITKSSDGNTKGDALAVGDQVPFQVTTTIPSYSDAYKTESLMFNITDTLSTGLTFVAPVTVKVGEDTVTASADTYTLTTSDSGFQIVFAPAYIKANGGKNVVVTYKAELNDQAEQNFDPNTNKVKIKYSNNPYKPTDGTEKESKTYQYTFSLDGRLTANDSIETERTHDVLKVDENGNAVKIDEVRDGIDKITNEHPLSGAKFTLTNTKTNKTYTATTDSNGYFDGFKGLDAGTYTLVEVDAPDGYTVDPTEHTVVITPEFNDDGTLKNYTVTVDGSTSTYSATYTSTGELQKIKADDKTTVIKNTKIKPLPSTGGIGTYIFTILGIAIMCIAASLFFADRRKRTNC